MRLSGCVWVVCLRYVGSEDGCFSGGDVLVSGRLRWAFGWTLLCGSVLGFHFMGVLSSSRARWARMLGFEAEG
jgi:hypothetical protein